MAQTGKRRSGQPKKEEAAKEAEEGSLHFDYIKGNYYRVIAVNGVIGGLTLDGDIHMAVWNQRQPYPKQVTHTVNPDGSVGPEVGRTTRDAAILREIEAGLVFPPQFAALLIEWLQGQLNRLAQLNAEVNIHAHETPSSGEDTSDGEQRDDANSKD